MTTSTDSSAALTQNPRSLIRSGSAASPIGERLINGWIFFCGLTSILFVALIFLFIFREAFPLFQTYSVREFFFGKEWTPTVTPPAFGLLPLLLSSLFVTLGAIVIAVPLGVSTAVYIAEVAPSRLRNFLKASVELLAAVPSVVLGFFGATVLAPLLQNQFEIIPGTNMLAGSLTLALMAVPTIATISEDALASVPKDIREGSLGLGATKWQTVRHVLIPAAFSGIVAAVMLGVGRAIGETMVVLMVTGNGVGSNLTALMNAPGADAATRFGTAPDNPLTALIGMFQHTFGAYGEVCRTLTATIAAEMGEVKTGGGHYRALFMLGVVLFVITFFVNLTADWALRRNRELNVRERSRSVILTQRILLGTVAVFVLLGLAASMGIVRFLVIGAIIAAAAGIFRLVGAERKRNQALMYGVMGLGALAVLLPTFYIFGAIFFGGIKQITPAFLTQAPEPSGASGGIGPAILGTFALMIGTILLALPLGIFAAIYLTEYAKKGPMVRAIRMAIINLAGVPSIVHGLFGLVVFRIFLGGWLDYFAGNTSAVWRDRTLLWGAATLAILVLPVIITATEEALASVPQSFREGSFGLGATRWQTIRRVILPAAIPGILTGAILAVGRAAGETAPILFTATIAFTTSIHAPTPNHPVLALPYQLYYVVTEAVNAPDQMKYGIALTLLLLVFAVNLTAILLRNRLRRARRW